MSLFPRQGQSYSKELGPTKVTEVTGAAGRRSDVVFRPGQARTEEVNVGTKPSRFTFIGGRQEFAFSDL